LFSAFEVGLSISIFPLFRKRVKDSINRSRSIPKSWDARGIDISPPLVAARYRRTRSSIAASGGSVTVSRLPQLWQNFCSPRFFVPQTAHEVSALPHFAHTVCFAAVFIPHWGQMSKLGEFNIVCFIRFVV